MISYANWHAALESAAENCEYEGYRATADELRDIAKAAPKLRALHTAAEHLGPWMSAALGDPKVCAEFKMRADAFIVALNDLREVQP